MCCVGGRVLVVVVAVVEVDVVELVEVRLDGTWGDNWTVRLAAL